VRRWLLALGMPLLVLGLLGCSPAQLAGVPALTTLDAIGRGVSVVLQWCQARGIQPETIASAQKAIAEKDYPYALDLLGRVVTASRAAGDPIPESVEVTLRLAEGAVAAQAIQDGMRALSAPHVDEAGTKP
jgi:hypothetical protein